MQRCRERIACNSLRAHHRFDGRCLRSLVTRLIESSSSRRGFGDRLAMLSFVSASHAGLP